MGKVSQKGAKFSLDRCMAMEERNENMLKDTENIHIMAYILIEGANFS
jgi:hypothetical protein